jgi:hypothetical protein
LIPQSHLYRPCQTLVINGEKAGDFISETVSSAGDVNGDGLDDLIIGAYETSPDGKVKAGKSFVVFGTADTPLTSPAEETEKPLKSSRLSPLITKPPDPESTFDNSMTSVALGLTKLNLMWYSVRITQMLLNYQA